MTPAKQPSTCNDTEPSTVQNNYSTQLSGTQREVFRWMPGVNHWTFLGTLIERRHGRIEECTSPLNVCLSLTTYILESSICNQRTIYAPSVLLNLAFREQNTLLPPSWLSQC
jgi:hypothetical protein